MKKNYYVYAYLDPRKSGHFKYKELEFSHEPFYIGEGKDNRMYKHLSESKQKKVNNYKINKIRKIQREIKSDPIIIKLFENLTKKEAREIETNLIKRIGRIDLRTGPLTNLKDQSFSPTELSQESRDKISVGVSKANIGSKRTEEQKVNMAIAQQKSYRDNPKRADKIGNALKDKPKSKKHKENLSKSLIGKTYEDFHGKEEAKRRKENQSKAMKGKEQTWTHGYKRTYWSQKSVNIKLIIQLYFDETLKSEREMINMYNEIEHLKITRSLKDSLKALGFTFIKRKQNIMEYKGKAHSFCKQYTTKKLWRIPELFAII